MRLLLLMHDPAARAVCAEYFAAHGYSVDMPGDRAEAERFARFVPYELMLVDEDRDDTGQHGALALTRAARRRNDAVVPVLLTTDNDVPAAAPAMHVFRKPQPLATILDWAHGVRQRQLPLSS